MILACFFASYDLAGALTLCRHRIIMASISFTLLTYYATFWPAGDGSQTYNLRLAWSKNKREVLTPIWGAWCIWNWLTKVIVLI